MNKKSCISGNYPAVVEQNGPFAVNYSMLPSVTAFIFGKAHGSQGFESRFDLILIWFN